MHGDEVGHGEQTGQVEDLDAHLSRTGLSDVGIVADEAHAEGLSALGDESADAAEADDAQSLLVEFDAGVLLPVPLPRLQRGVAGTEVASRTEDVGHRQLGCGDDVRRGCVDDHDTRRGGRGDIDIVESDSGAGDDLEVLRSVDGLGVDLGGRPDEDRICVGDGGQELGSVSALGVTDLEVSSESIDGGR